MNTSHTPGPWAIGKKYKSDIYTSGGGKLIARTVSSAGIMSLATDADAAFIVRAVNAHDDLVAALQEALPYLDELYKLNTYAGVTALKMRAAITKAIQS